MKNIKPDIGKCILTGMALGKAFTIGLGAFFNVGKDWFYIDFNKSCLFHGTSKNDLERVKAKEICYVLEKVEYRLDGLYMEIYFNGVKKSRKFNWDLINVE